MTETQLSKAQISEHLLEWFSHNKIEHFFRKNRTPYSVWVSEVALQQTRIESAIPVLKRFYKKYPSVNSLAEANEDEVVSTWQGLGYYSRARNLRKGAIYLQKHHNAKLPKILTELLKVPSIGPYTASAISSICFKMKEPAIDSNVKRIYSRMKKNNQELNHPTFINDCHHYLKSQLESSDEHPGEINEAWMQLGQLICKSRSPLCNICPISNFCLSAHQSELQRPTLLKKKAQIKKVDWKLFIYKNHKGEILLHQYEDFYLLANHWGLPSILSLPDLSHTYTSCQSINETHDQLESFIIGKFKHSITNHRINATVYQIDFQKKDGENNSKQLHRQKLKNFRWATKQKALEIFASSLFTKAIRINIQKQIPYKKLL